MALSNNPTPNELVKAVKDIEQTDFVTHDDSSAVSESTLLDNYYTKTQIVDLIYPIGSVFITVNNVNPSTYLPNTNWELIEDRFLLGAGSTYTAGATGGEATHTLTIDEMPAHYHGLSSTNAGSYNDDYQWVKPYGNNTGGGSVSTKVVAELSVSGMNAQRYVENYGYNNQPMSSKGGSQPHNNMPPYLVVYMWKRVPLANS